MNQVNIKDQESQPLSAVALIVLLLLPLGSSLCIDMYLPAYSNIAEYYNIPESYLNISMGIYLLGLAIGQLIYGPISDRFGRRKPLLIGSFLFVIASIFCCISPNYIIFLIFRLLQALGACAAIVLSRAIIVDSYNRNRQVRLLSLLSAINIVSPAIAPILGGYMLLYFSWISIFISVLIFSIFAFISSYIFIQETYIADNNSDINLKAKYNKKIINMLSNFKFLLFDKNYITFALSAALLYGLAFVWVTLSPAIVINEFKVPQYYFGYFFAMQCLGNTVGSLIAAVYSSEVYEIKLQKLGFLVLISCSVIVGLLFAVNLLNEILLAIAVVILYLAAGLTQPSLIAIACRAHPKMRGLSAGLLGFMQTSLGAVVAIICSIFYDYSMNSMVWLFLLFSISSYLIIHLKTIDMNNQNVEQVIN
tara:strand:- start:54990 stop:56252 length:1263 start_codon:yes stop_codon:yes gene_type:complete